MARSKNENWTVKEISDALAVNKMSAFTQQLVRMAHMHMHSFMVFAAFHILNPRKVF